ncbi:hypothetical protein E9993_07815 [Labilibacter sediminis]|nr:hypothetical protein E9993_07815 [Labilibacter sediminis]
MDSSIKKQIKTLNIIYLAILISMSAALIFSLVFIYKSGAIPVFGADDQGFIKSMVIIALLVGIPVSHIFFHKKVKHINSDLPLSKKVAMFQTAFIVRIAMLEAIGLLAVIGYLVAADKSFLYMFGVVFVLFIIHAPTKQRICGDLELSEEEENQILS